MSDHIPDAGDPDATPIMDAVDAKCDELNVMDAICYAVYEGQKLEIQLNEANQRVKRLETLGHELRECASRIGTVASGEGSVIRRTEEAIQAWDKEAKL